MLMEIVKEQLSRWLPEELCVQSGNHDPPLAAYFTIHEFL